MKRLVSLFVLSFIAFDVFAAQSTGRRPAMSDRIMSAPRYTASVNQLNGMSMGTVTKTTTNTKTEEITEEEQKDMREAERNACLNNNIGIGNTFVWASKYSDVSNYALMKEDIKNPENNVCFVRVELKSNDESRISVSDIEPKYFMWGEDIECGSWVNEKEMERRILEARKGARIGGIVASTVGGLGLGVGVMEAFGNKMFDKVSGGKLEGQRSKYLSEGDTKTFYIKQMENLKETNPAKYEEYIGYIRSIKDNLNSYQSSKNYEVYKILVDEYGNN
ncbi:MAG: hypothetical protein IKN73_01055 [Alphaproteobacteria bacterium]|nr:hypothetical protein [Alphaproteobacteria bacterium]